MRSDIQPNPPTMKQGVRVAPADAATPVGTAQFRLDMTGAVDVNMATAAAALPLSEWLLRTDSQANGTFWTFLRPGVYKVLVHFSQTGAVRNSVGVVRGSAALPANPTLATGARVLSNNSFLGVAAQALTYTHEVEVVVADQDLDGNNNTIQVQVTDGAGATGAGLVNTECGVTIWKEQHVQSLA
jgi:hypothetical protein